MAFTKLTTSTCLLFLLCSCGAIVKNLRKETIPLKPIATGAGYCTEKTADYVLLGRDKSGVLIFESFLKKASKIRSLNKTEKLVLWSLFQMNQRPDLASPSARFQILVSTKNGIQYYDFKDSSLDMDIPKLAPPTTFLFGLETILKSYSSGSSLLGLALLLETYLPSKIPITSDFSEFISKNEKKLRNHEVFSSSFFKAGEQLHYGESIARLSFSQIIKNYNRSKNKSSNDMTISQKLFTYKLPGESNQEANCNVDLAQYELNKYNIASEDNENHHPFGVQFSDGQFFLAITSIAKRNFKPLMNSYLMETTQSEDSVPLCYRKTEEGTYAYLSFKGRDPGQYLYNLFQYNIQNSKSSEELDQYLKFPRHLVLRDPLRLLFESSRGTEEDLRSFIKRDIPIYHSQSLGEIWLHAPGTGFVIDDRGKANLSCMN